MRIVHPFHPLSGREFVLVSERHDRHGDRVWYLDAEGGTRSVPRAWTDLAAPEPFVVMAGGRAHFRPADLVELAGLIAEIRGVSTGSGGVGDV